MVKWHAAELAATAVEPKQYPRHDLPEVALVGRSNVGKSSLINRLLGRRLARTSNTPGRTQTLNFYAVDKRLCLVDLSGYGYARVPMRMRRRWQPMIEHYLTERPNLVGVIQVVDIRHPPTEDDKTMAAWLARRGLPAVAVATKADKIARGRRPQHVARMARELGLPVLAFSAATGEGRDDVIGVLKAMLLEARLAGEASGVSGATGGADGPDAAEGAGTDEGPGAPEAQRGG